MINVSDEQRAHFKSITREYINDYCIYRVLEGNAPLPALNHSTPYNWQIYLRRGLFNAKFLNTIGVLFWDLYADQYKQKPFQIAGFETGSTPLIVGIAMTASLFDIDVNAVSIRKDKKSYGLFNRFEGIVDYNLPVLLVDDLCNSANTLAQAMHYVLAEQLELYDSGFAIINKDIDKSHPDFDKYIGPSFKINSLFTIDQFDLTVSSYLKRNPNKQYIAFNHEKNKS